VLGDEIRRVREAAGLTQEQLAERADVHRTYVSLLERDKKSPTVAVLVRLCGALGVAPSTLLRRVESRTNERADAGAARDES
jgi:transcriptional regulator with XRE-family HTH domain